LAAKGCIIQASLRYIDENREKLLAEYPTVDDFEARFEVNDAFVEMLKQQGVMDSVKLEGGDEEFQRSLPEIKLQLKQLVARDLWDMSDFMKLYNKNNDIFQKAYELIKVKKFEELMIK
jgi:carboxyl-terminal processing protease